MIEVGRWNKPKKIPTNERKCLKCNAMEDEYHFLLVCPLYNALRNEYVNKYYHQYPSHENFTRLLTNPRIDVIRNLSIFITKAFALLNEQTFTI